VFDELEGSARNLGSIAVARQSHPRAKIKASREQTARGAIGLAGTGEKSWRAFHI
jgi:hypothetical protein